MGAVQSSGMLGQTRKRRRRHRSTQSPSSMGNLILSFKDNKMCVVSADTSVLTLLTLIIRRHGKILQEGWNNLTYSYCMSAMDHKTIIHLMADVLLSLYQVGLEPMASFDIGKKKKTCQKGPHTMVFFKKREDMGRKDSFGSKCSIFSRSKSLDNGENSWLGLETCYSDLLQLHNVSNSVLHSLVTSVQSSNIIHSVSMGVASVITDYTTNMPNIIKGNEKYIQFHKNSWTVDENLPVSVVTCLAEEGYSLIVDITIDTDRRIFFFIKNYEVNSHNFGSTEGEKRSLLIRNSSIDCDESSRN